MSRGSSKGAGITDVLPLNWSKQVTYASGYYKRFQFMTFDQNNKKSVWSSKNGYTASKFVYEDFKKHHHY